jgi:hypothetical protein
MQNPLRKNSRQKQRMIPNVRANNKTRPLIRILERGQQFKEIFQAVRLPGNIHARTFLQRIFRKHFRDVIRHFTIFNARAPKNIPHHHVKIKMAGDTQTSAIFEQGMKKRLIVENQIARIGIRQQPNQTIRTARSTLQRLGDEIDVVRCELYPAVRQNDSHTQ